ncbi:hypothetical protein NC652_007751 [Populus alba x Populus x berolinensis]|nr:hypothetical protein NC652_007751 [Populus alba x Populus x berolinensis]
MLNISAQPSCTKSKKDSLLPSSIGFLHHLPFSRLLSPFLPYLGSSTYPHKVITAFFICNVPIYFFVGISIFFSSPASRQWQVLCIMALSSYSSLLSLPSTLRLHKWKISWTVVDTCLLSMVLVVLPTVNFQATRTRKTSKWKLVSAFPLCCCFSSVPSLPFSLSLYVLNFGSYYFSVGLVKQCDCLQVIAVEPVSDLKLNSRILQDSILKKVNGNPKAGWKATMNHHFSNYTVAQFKYLLGVKPTPKEELRGIPVISHPKSLRLPEEFDARTAWPQCSTIGKILGHFLSCFLIFMVVFMGHCGSCWAFGAVESLSDRFCIHYGMNISLSVNDLLACCGFLCGSGCNGGYPISAWRYFVHHGVVTEECDPYFDDIGCSHPGCEPGYPTPKCARKCVNKNQLWKKSKHYGVKPYRIDSDPDSIMAEIYKNGPVEVAFTVYEDFAHYKSGVYKHITGGMMGGHAVKLIGWGTSEDGEAYWLLANQWNRGWGDDGYFKIRRGTNECGIEGDVVAGLPSTGILLERNGLSLYAWDETRFTFLACIITSHLLPPSSAARHFQHMKLLEKELYSSSAKCLHSSCAAITTAECGRGVGVKRSKD